MIALFHCAAGGLVEGPLCYLMLAWGFVDPQHRDHNVCWDLAKSLVKWIFDRFMPKVATSYFSAVCFGCSLSCWPVSYCMPWLGCDVRSSCLSRAITLCIPATTVSVLPLSRWELHPAPKLQGRSLCRLLLIVHFGKTPWSKEVPIFLQRDRKERSLSVPKTALKGVSVRAASQRCLPTKPYCTMKSSMLALGTDVSSHAL